MIIYTEACFFCEHLDQTTKNGRQSKYKCTAFPEGVPEEIYQGVYDHRYSYPEDSGIRFEINKNHKADYDEIQDIFKTIERNRKKRIDNPMYTNPLSYDWWKS